MKKILMASSCLLSFLSCSYVHATTPIINNFGTLNIYNATGSDIAFGTIIVAYEAHIVSMNPSAGSSAAPETTATMTAETDTNIVGPLSGIPSIEKKVLDTNGNTIATAYIQYSWSNTSHKLEPGYICQPVSGYRCYQTDLAPNHYFTSPNFILSKFFKSQGH